MRRWQLVRDRRKLDRHESRRCSSAAKISLPLTIWPPRDQSCSARPRRGIAHAGLALAAPFGPLVLQKLKVYGFAGNGDGARLKANELGAAEAPRRLELLATLRLVAKRDGL